MARKPTSPNGLSPAPSLQRPLATQRRLRENMDAAMKRGLIAVIDMGSTRTACLVLRIDHGILQRALAEGRLAAAYEAIRVLGVGNIRADGVRCGTIVNMEQAVQSVRKALLQAEGMAGVRTNQAIVNLTGGFPRSHSLSAEVEIRGLTVTQRDISAALLACQPPPEGPGRDVIHAIPVNWGVDNEQRRAPLGMAGKRLAVDMHVLSVETAALRDIVTCINQASLDLAGIVSTPYAAGLACLVEDELDMGCACIDMGGGVTSVSMFLQRQLVFADLVRMGGDHVTSDIMRGLGVSQAVAERMKTLNGGTLATEADDRDMIEAPILGEEAAAGRRLVPRSALIGIIRPRVEETLELARDRLKQAGFDYLPIQQAVLTGGACQLPGVLETAQRIIGRKVRIGRPIQIAGLPMNMVQPGFSTLVGLVAYLIRGQDELWDMLPEGESSGTFGGLLKWLRETW